MVETQTESEKVSERPPLWRRTWFCVTAGVTVVVIVLLGIFAEYASHHAEPLLRKAIVDSLEQRFHETVELDSLGVSVLHGLQVEGHGLRLYPAPAVHTPIVTIQKFTFFESMDDLLHLRERVNTIYVDGLELHIPPHSMHSLAAPGIPHSPIKLLVGKVVCRDALVVIDTDKPGKQPLQFQIDTLSLQDFGTTQPFLYQADLINPKPKGRIQVSGHIGPWKADSPRDTPLDGSFTFSHADLNTIKGLGGTLGSTGKFTGVLSSLAVDGTTHTPDFSLDIGNHPMVLDTTYHAIVDGTTGDTTLAPVNAKLANSYFVATGTIVRVPIPAEKGEDIGRLRSLGHNIALKVTMQRGRIEDLLELAVKSEPPLMKGALTMQADVNIPPGHARVIDKLHLAGTVHINGVEFTNQKLQDRVDGLSMRAQGKPEEVKVAGSDHKAEVASQMTVQFVLGGGIVKADSLHYELPGAHIQMVGVYDLNSHRFEFDGHVRTDAKASQMVTGWKSALLKPFDGLFAKNGAGLQLPISINGVNGDFSFGLHDSKLTADQMAAQMEHPGTSPPSTTQTQTKSYPDMQAMPR